MTDRPRPYTLTDGRGVVLPVSIAHLDQCGAVDPATVRPGCYTFALNQAGASVFGAFDLVSDARPPAAWADQVRQCVEVWSDCGRFCRHELRPVA